MIDSDRYTFIYNSNKELDKKLFAHAKAEKLRFKELDIYHDRSDLTTTRLKEIAGQLKWDLRDLVDPKQAQAMKIENYNELGEQDLLTLLDKNILLLKTPLFSTGKSIHHLQYSNDINKLDLTNGQPASESEHFQQ